MGKIIAALAISLDGYAEGPKADLSVMPLDEAFNIHNAQLIKSADRLIYGAKTYRMMLSHWPSVLDDPAASEAEHEIAQRCADGLPITVISDSLTVDDTDPWREQTTIVSQYDAAEALAAMRHGNETAAIFGSQTLVAHLLSLGLVDRISLMVGPKMVAGDRPAFKNVPVVDLQLSGVTRYPGSDNIVLDYDIPPSALGNGSRKNE